MSDRARFEGKVALVTGAAGGIGEAVARGFAREGARLILWDTDEDGLAQVAASIGREGAQLGALSVNVAIYNDVVKGIEEVQRRLGRVDLLAHCAGVMSPFDIEDCNVDEWERTISINLSGTFNVFKAVVPIMKDQEGGRIIAISSAAARSASTVSGVAYVAAKAGIEAMVRQLAFRLAPHAITVNAVAPGAVDTVMPRDSFSAEELNRMVETIPLRRMARPEEVAEAVLYLGSEAASYVTGEILDLNGGSLVD